jgi:hypothetical protein
VDKNDSDPITRPLYLLMLSWFLQSGQVSNWLFSLLQWNCIGRSISIDPLGFQNFHMGTDGMKIEYEFTKSDQSGEKVKGKNIYANPLDPHQCLFTGMGIFLSLNRGSFDNSHHFFIRAGKIGSAAKKYCSDMVSLFKAHKVVAEQYCRIERTGSHGTRKGAGTYSTSGTTFPPPLSSVAHPGDWSQGHVFDVYLQFADPGDQYLGRILAGLDPNTSDFALLPPHFTIPSTNQDIDEALVMCFGNLAEKYRFKGQLMFCLASMVHHIDWIRDTAARDPQHPFNALPILRCPNRFAKLKGFVSTRASTYLSQPTGIPPHVNQLQVIREVALSLQDVVLKLDELAIRIHDTVIKAIETNDIQSGNVTMQTLKEHLHEFGNQLSTNILKKLEEQGLLLPAGKLSQQLALQVDSPESNDFDSGTGTGGTAIESRNLPTHVYQVQGTDCMNWDVPSNYNFPRKMSLENGWQAWILGFPGHQVLGDDSILIHAPVRPIRKVRPQFLPNLKLKNDLKTQWTPVFAMMEEGIASLGVPPNSYGSWSSEAHVTQLYVMGREYLRRRASYIWLMPKSRPESWAISHWSKKLSRSEIEKNGNASDLEMLPAPKKCNRSHPFFAKSSMTIVDRMLVLGEEEGTYTPKKRRKSTVNHAAITPESSSTNPTELLLEEEDKDSKMKTENVQQIARLGIQDHRSSNEILFFVKDSSIPDSEYTAMSRNKNVPTIPTLAIRRVNLENLQSQGKMLDSFVVTAYFKTLGRQYFHDGVRVVDDTFIKWLALDSHADEEKVSVSYG